MVSDTGKRESKQARRAPGLFRTSRFKGFSGGPSESSTLATVRFLEIGASSISQAAEARRRFFRPPGNNAPRSCSNRSVTRREMAFSRFLSAIRISISVSFYPLNACPYPHLPASNLSTPTSTETMQSAPVRCCARKHTLCMRPL